MNCHSVRAVLDLHAEGRLTARRGTKVSAHIEGCAECRALAAPLAAKAVKAPASDFKSKLAASLKAQRKAEPAPAFSPNIELWPRDLTGVALACAALAVIALAIGWSGVPSQKEFSGDELAAGRTP
jgi:anti-sigma factor RsiW